MNLELFNNLRNTKENNFIQNFINELSKELKKGKLNMAIEMKEENTLYQVVDKSVNGIYLKNTKTNEIFEETNLPQEMQETIENDYILRYKNGEYVFEEELTDNFFDSLVSMKEYKEIQEQFINENNVLEIKPYTIFKIETHGKDYSILSYEDKTIKVPNTLIPYFADEGTELKYEEGEFKKIR